ncbi:MAG: hypothetical protein AAGF01_12790 [Cyanobacteria bacterium P01_G01_bin.38]
MKSAYRLWSALGGLAMASALVLTEPECSNLTPADLERFANGETVAYETCNPHRLPVIGLSLMALGLGAWWYFDPAQRPMQPLAPPRLEKPVPGLSLRQAVADAIRTNPDYHWLLKLLECNTLLIVGPQGSGKTRFAVALAYLRMIIRQHVIRDVNALGHQEAGWPGQSFRSGHDLDAIADRVSDYLEKLKTKKRPPYPYTEPLTHVLDEFILRPDKQFSRRSAKEIKPPDGLFTSITTESHKACEHPILVAHGQRRGPLSGSHTRAGAPPFKHDYIVLSLHGARTLTGVPVVSHKATVMGIDVDPEGKPVQASVAYPAWFNPEVLAEVLVALPASFHLEARKSYQQAVNQPTDAKTLTVSEDCDDLEKSWELVDGSTLTSVFSAKPPEKPITPVEAIDLLLSHKTPKDLIVEYWGVHQGRAYREVSDLLKNAISEYASLEQWRQLKANHSKFFGA